MPSVTVSSLMFCDYNTLLRVESNFELIVSSRSCLQAVREQSACQDRVEQTGLLLLQILHMRVDTFKQFVLHSPYPLGKRSTLRYGHLDLGKNPQLNLNPVSLLIDFTQSVGKDRIKDVRLIVRRIGLLASTKFLLA